MIRDISPPIKPGMVVWPGDTGFAQEPHLRIGGSCPVNVDRITLSTHTGAHADAPRHYRSDGTAVGGLDLQPYVGPCRLIDGRGAGALLEPDSVRSALAGAPPRVLLRTYDQTPAHWDPGFSAIAVSTIELLAAHDVILVGIDTPSIDPQSAKELAAHHAAYAHGIAILEGLLLDRVPAGDYELLALPLRLLDADAAPVRAVLRDLP